jgi:hypothetical protein
MTPDPTGHPLDPIRQIANDMEAERRAKAQDRARVLLALADRVEREEPSFDLSCALKQAIGHDDPLWHFRPYLTSLDAAASAMPAGWRIWQIEQTDTGFSVALYHPERAAHPIRASAPDEPRARTAAALRAMAAEASNADPR